MRPEPECGAASDLVIGGPTKFAYVTCNTVSLKTVNNITGTNFKTRRGLSHVTYSTVSSKNVNLQYATPCRNNPHYIYNNAKTT